MSIKTLIDDAVFLREHGRQEGAWTLALIAAAATARKRYPRPMRDGPSFKAFIRDIAHIIATGKSDGPTPISICYGDKSNHRKMEDIIYEELRCNLVHEAELKDITFSEGTRVAEGRYAFPISIPPQGPAVIPAIWISCLIEAIKAAPENAELFET
jgi:hypothetical protein